MEAVSSIILVGAILLVTSIATSVVSFRIGAPLLLVFLLVGLLAGEDGPGGIKFDDAPAAFFIGSIALALILFDSGFNTRWASYRAAAGPSLMLATVGVLLTTAFVGAAAVFLFGLPWSEGLLIGGIISSTDAAAVFFLLRVGGITLRDRVRSTLEIESGSNDPIAIFLVIALTEMIAAGDIEPGWSLVGTFLSQLGGGLVGGIVGGLAIVLAVSRLRLEPGLYPVLSLALAMLIFAATGVLHGSGFLAVYVAGLIAGNAGLPHTAVLRRFHDGLTWLAQIVMFVMLGLLATPSQFDVTLTAGVLLGLLLILVARPLAVWLCLLPFRFPARETAFVGWVGLRGAVSILLSTVPILYGLPGAQTMFNIVFEMVLVSLLVQGWTIKPVAHWLGLTVPRRHGPIDRIELELPHDTGHELVIYGVQAGSAVARGRRLPRWARPSLIIRDGRPLSIHTVRQLQPGDHLYLFVTPRHIPLLDKLFAGAGEIPDDDSELYGDFALKPDVTVQAVAEMYGLPLPLEKADLSVAELLRQELVGDVEAGDRLRFGGIELIVRDVENGEIASVGLVLEPVALTPPSLSRRIGALWRSLRNIRRARHAE